MSRHRAAQPEDTLSFSFNHPLGALGIDNDHRHPFARALVKLLRSGSPIERLGMAFFSVKAPDVEPEVGDVRWLGVFAASDGGRMIFFPGTERSLFGERAVRGGRTEWQGSFPVDHLTLDADRRAWHITTAGSKAHRAASRTLDLGGGRVLWCSMQFREAAILRQVLRTTTVVARVPGSAARRRADVLAAAREGVEFPIVSAPRHPAITLAGGFLHIAFVVGPHAFGTYDGGQLGWPFDSPFLLERLSGDLRGQPVRTTRLSLPPIADIDIHACWLRGRIGVEAVLTGQSESWPEREA